MRSNRICLFLLFIAFSVSLKGNYDLSYQRFQETAQQGDSPPVTLFMAGEDTIQARPDRGFYITYHWRGDSVGGNYQVIFRILDQKGESVFEDNHYPPVSTSLWNGDVNYSRLVTLPVWEMTDNNTRTVNVMLPEGEYEMVSGLYDPNTATMIELTEGPGVTQVKTGLYRIGTLQLDSLAPVRGPGEPTLDLSGYHLTFDEEFDSLNVSAFGPVGEGGSRWIAHTPWYGDFGDADFVNPGSGFPFTTENGILRIEASKKSGQWQSGLLSAVDTEGRGFKQQFGYFECRAKLPSGPGVWPAFWLMGTLNRWGSGPRINPEVDILEQYGHWPNRFSFALHLWGLGGLSSSHEGTRIEVLGMQDDFHNYGMRIEEDSMILYFDGVEMYRRKTPDELNTPLYPLVNLALGPGWPLDKTPDPSYMYVDYIRIYARYFTSDLMDIDWSGRLIRMPWGTYRDSALLFLDASRDIEITYQFSPNPEDSLHQIVRTGDSLFVHDAEGDVPAGFRIEVMDPAGDDARVFPLKKKVSADRYEQVFSVTETNAESGIISHVPYETTSDSLFTYLEKAPSATWQIIRQNTRTGTRLVSGDILRVSAPNGTTTRSYFIDVDSIPASSHNATLGAIVWPDAPGWVLSDPDWNHDTIPGFVPDIFEYVLMLPLETDVVPVLQVFPGDVNTRIMVEGAKTTEGPLQNRTTIIDVVAEDDTTTNRYVIVFQKKNLPDPIVYSDTYLVRNDSLIIRGIWAGTTVEEFLSNMIPGNKSPDLLVISSQDGSFRSSGEILSPQDTLLVVTRDSSAMTKYLLKTSDTGLDSNAVLTSNSLQIETTGEEGVVSGFAYGTSVQAVIDSIRVPPSANMIVVNDNGEPVPLHMLNYAGTYHPTQVSDRLRFRVTAQDMHTIITYKLQPDTLSDELFVFSDLFIVDDAMRLISAIPEGISIPDFLSKLWTNGSATLKISDPNGSNRTMVPVEDDFRLLAISEQRNVKKTYFLQFTGEEGVHAYLLSEVFEVNQVSGEIYGITDRVSVDSLMGSVTTAPQATLKLIDKEGREKTAGMINPGEDQLEVTSGNGEKVVTYALFGSQRFLITFIVRDEKGLVAEASITIGMDTLKTDEKGVASVMLADGEYDYYVRHENDDADGILNIDGSSVTREITLSEILYPVVITVMEGSNPVANAMVMINGQYYMANTMGEVSVELPQGTYDYSISASGHEDITGTVDLLDSGKSLTIDLQEVTLQNESIEKIRIYPNPSEGKFMIRRDQPNAIMEIQLRDLSGRLIYDRQFGPASLNTISLSDPEPGVLFIRIIIGRSVSNRMIIIQ